MVYFAKLTALLLFLFVLTACNPLKPELVDNSLGKIRSAAVFVHFTSKTDPSSPRSTKLSEALQAALPVQKAQILPEGASAFLPQPDFPDNPMNVIRARAPAATHAIIIRASIASRPHIIPGHYDYCASQDKKGKCISGWVGDEKKIGSIEANLEVFDLAANRAIYRAGTGSGMTNVTIGYTEDTADSAASAVAKRIMVSLREAKLL